MKKILLIALGVFFSGAIVWAVVVNVDSISEKSSGDSVSFQEFNNIVGTIKGIFNKNVNGRNKIGINTLPSDIASLKLNDGLIMVRPLFQGESAMPICGQSTAGAIYVDATDRHLWGCDGLYWVQLDTGC